MIDAPHTFYECPFSTPSRTAGATTWSKAALQPDEIQRVIAGEKGQLQPAEIEQLRDGVYVQVQDPKHRASMVRGIFLNDETRWLYERLTQIARDLNSKFYGYDLTGVEPLQYATYSAERAEHFDWHHDLGGKRYGRKRKLTLIVQLSDPSEYEGGELMTFNGAEPLIANKEIGALVAFPSYTLHRVAPVAKGVRRSLTCWAVGPDFR
jgi:PKHD-type hydroxylase